MNLLIFFGFLFGKFYLSKGDSRYLGIYINKL